MTVETISPHSAPTARGDELHALAQQLYQRVSSGHDALAWNVDPRGPALTTLGADGTRRPVQVGGDSSAAAPAWQRARELREDGSVVDRRFNPWVLERHLRGRYSVAPAAPGWVEWAALDIDAHRAAGESELVARLRALRVLGHVWRALNCSAERHPLVLRSPGGGYHLWFPLTRGPSSANPEHTWPSHAVRGWFERHLAEAGIQLSPGTLEVFPSGRCLRAPCGVGMVLLQATRPSDPDALGLVPWTGTMRDDRVDWRGARAALSSPVRHVVPMVRAFVSAWDAQRRTLAEWLGRPEASWDPAWGPLAWRTDPESSATPAAEKKPAEGARGDDSRSQQSGDVPGRYHAGRTQFRTEGFGKRGRGRAVPGSGSGPVPDEKIIPAAPEADDPPVPAGASLVRGRAFKEKVQKLLWEGITQPSTRHDAVLTLVFYWGATCGLPLERVLARLEAWCRGHLHGGSRLAPRHRAFVATCLREARHYFEHYSPGWPFRGAGDGGGLGTLTRMDQEVLAAIDPRVRDESAAVLAWLAGRADGNGRIGEPVQIATGLLARLCGDRRVDDDGKRRRATTLALAELERIGVLTLAHDYRVGQCGRVWSCWYRFGSGELPRVVELPASEWAALEHPLAVAKVPTLAIVPVPEPRQEGVSAPVVTVRVVGERVVPEGLLRILSDGARGRPRTLLTLAADVALPTAIPSACPPWFVRAFQSRTFTPNTLWTANAATVVAFPDVEARRRMPRDERLVWGGGRGDRRPAPARTSVTASPAGGGQPSGPGDDAAATVMSPPEESDVDRRPEVAAEALRAELEAEVGTAASTALPRDLIDEVAQAWRAFKRGQDP
jgi:hypothetical protein